MQFCFGLFCCFMGGVSVFAGAAAGSTGGKSDVSRASAKPRMQSVVQVDPVTGRLIRVVDGAKPRSASSSKPLQAADTAKLKAIVEETARSYSVDPLLVQSVIQTESAYSPVAISVKGAQGLMQLMPATARRFGVNNVYDPKENIEGGVKYLKYLQDLFQDDRLAIAAYNAGEGAVAKYKGVPPYKETVDYVEKVSGRYGKAKQDAPAKQAAVLTDALSANESVVITRPVITYTDSEGRLHMTTQ